MTEQSRYVKKIKAGGQVVQIGDTGQEKLVGAEHGTIFFDPDNGVLKITDQNHPNGWKYVYTGTGISYLATTSTVGAVKVNTEGLYLTLDALVGLNTATDTVMGGIKLGKNLVRDGTGKINIDSTLFIGDTFLDHYSDVGHTLVQLDANIDDYSQLSIQNRNTGTNASSDLSLYNDLSTGDLDHYIDIGINSSNYVSPDYSVQPPGSAYVYTADVDLVIGTQSPDTRLIFHAGGTTREQSVGSFDQYGWTFNRQVIVTDRRNGPLVFSTQNISTGSGATAIYQGQNDNGSYFQFGIHGSNKVDGNILGSEAFFIAQGTGENLHIGSQPSINFYADYNNGNSGAPTLRLDRDTQSAIFRGHLLPRNDVAQDLGSPSKQWRSLYVSTNTIYINNVPMSINNNGQLIINGNPIQGGGNANTGNWAWYNNTAGTPANIDLQIQTVSTASQRGYSFWISEYGNLGSNPGSSQAIGVGALYDSQGNLYVLGAAGNFQDRLDSLLLKYDPLGNLLWHKTWRDPSGSPCGASNVALAIDSTDRIYWIANDWVAGGCWFGYMDTEGNLGLGGASQEVIGLGNVFPTDLACDDEHAYISGTINITDPININVPIVIKVNGNTGDIVWTSDIIPLDSTASTSTGIYRAITLDPTTGDVFTIGDYYDQGPTWAMLSKWNSAGQSLWTKKLVTVSGDIGEAVVYNNGYIYTIVNDYAEAKTVVSKFTTNGNLLWASNLAIGSVVSSLGTNTGGFDLSFDADNFVYVTGTLPYPNIDISNIWLSKLDPVTGSILYSRVLATSQGAAVYDGSSAPIAGHRVGDIYNNRIAVTALTNSDLEQAGNFAPRLIVSQLPIDGSIVGTYSNIVIYDATDNISSISTTGTYNLTTLTWTTQNLGTALVTRSQLSASNTTVVNTMTGKTITMAAGPVIGTTVTTSTWKFTTNGDLVLPAGGSITAKDNGPVKIKAGDETAYWWSEYGDLLIDTQDDWGSSVEYDSHGNIYIAGATYHNLNDNSSNIKALLIKYSPTGQLLWQKALFDQNDIYTRGEGLWIDSADNLYMIAENDDTIWSYLLKLDTNGNIIWQLRFDPSPDDNIHLVDIDGDNLGHVYIVGTGNYIHTNNRHMPWVACFDTQTGSNVWQKFIDITDATEWSTNGYGIAVDRSGTSVYVTGETYINNGWQAMLISLSASTGVLNWSQELLRGDGWGNYDYDVAVDQYGQIYTVGLNSSGAEITKWNSLGTLLWSKVIDKFGNSTAFSLDFDRDGYLYITGQSQPANTNHNGWLVVKMNQQGDIVWQNVLTSSVNNVYQYYYEGHKEIAVNSDRNSLVITGYTHVGTTATIRENLYQNNILTAQFPLDGTMTGEHGPFRYIATELSIANNNVTANSEITVIVSTSTYAITTASVATITNDEAADTHLLTGDTWTFTTDGHIVLPPNGDIIDGTSGRSVLGRLKNNSYIAELDNNGLLIDAAGRSMTGELNRRTDSGNNFQRVPVAIKNATGYKRLVGVSTSPQTWLSLTDVAVGLGINRYWITGMVIDYQAQSSTIGYLGSMVGQIIIASNQNNLMNVTHIESAITQSNSTNDIVFANLDLWRVNGGQLQAVRTDNTSNQQLDIIWTAKVFFNATEDYC